MSLLSVSHLSRRFGGVTAVDDVSFTVEAGEAVALIGPNGAGKSTCFNLIDGQLAADTGEILFDGRPITGFKPRQLFRLGIARTFQIATVFPTMKVAENVQLALLSHRREIFRFAGAVAKRRRSEALELLARVGLSDRADRATRMLAYGDVKRLELAIALANRPRLLLMDEPAAGMAPQERSQLVDLVRGVVADGEVSVLFTEHSMDVVFAFADRVLVLADGRLISAGTPDEVRADKMVQERYLGTGLGALS